VASLLALTISVIGAIAELSAPAPNLQFAPGEQASDSSVRPGTRAEFEAALAAVEQANLAVNNDPETNHPSLAAAIEQLSSFGPQIAEDARAREVLDLSLLNLARARLLTGDEAGAGEVMDQVLRSAYGRTLPIKSFGPTLVEFHDQRRALLEQQGTAAIQVQCRVSCRVVIDAQPATADSGPLYLGTHRLFIEAVDGSVADVDLAIELGEAGATEVIHYPAEEPTCDQVAPVVAPPQPPPPPPKRILPRWAEITVAAIGVGAAVAGGVMLGLDGKCPGGRDPVADAQQCPTLYEGTVPGLVAIGIGSALLIAGTVTLSVDEVRIGKERGRQAMLTWQMRF
jgi:hypothetical protein